MLVTFCDGQMFAGPGRGFGHGRSHPRSPAFRDYDSISPSRIGGAKNCSQIVRVLHSIQHDDERVAAHAWPQSHPQGRCIAFAEVTATTPWCALLPAMWSSSSSRGTKRTGHFPAAGIHQTTCFRRRSWRSFFRNSYPRKGCVPRAFSASATALITVDVIHERSV